ncbi:MAG TPA: hypothetical protein VFB04_01010 [Terriglobales bacterium]|nr:hypothetical protein [Terriglobales bacterium]
MSSRLTVEIIGSASDRKDVRLSDFIEQLRNIKKALHETELAISGADKPLLDYKVVDLRHNSPATVVLVQAGDVPPRPDLMPEVVNNFTAELSLIKREKKLLIHPDLPRLQAYQEIGRRESTQSRVEAVRIRSGRKVVTIDQAFQRNLDEIVGPDEFADGSTSGMLDAVNFHNTNRFTLYPPLGPRKVYGTFQPELRAVVKQAIGTFVTIVGKLRYKAWSPYPHGVIAELSQVCKTPYMKWKLMNRFCSHLL